jgi:hypothetical protein
VTKCYVSPINASPRFIRGTSRFDEAYGGPGRTFAKFQNAFRKRLGDVECFFTLWMVFKAIVEPLLDKISYTVQAPLLVAKVMPADFKCVPWKDRL